MRIARPASTIGGLMAAALLLGGCLSIQSSFTIDDDGTADVEFVTLFDTEQLGELAGLFGEDAGDIAALSGEELLAELGDGADLCADLTTSLAGDYEVDRAEIDNGAEVGVGCTVRDVPIDELSDGGLGDGSSFSIEQDENGTRFRAVLEGVDELEADTTGTTDFIDLDFDELFQILFVVSAPGSLGANNASSTDGATATWQVTTDAAFVTDGDALLEAEWTPGGGSSSNSLVPILIIVGLAIAAVVGFLLYRKNSSSPQPVATGATGPAPTAPPPPPPGAPTAATAPPATTPPPPPPPAGPASPPMIDTPPPPPPAAPPSTPDASSGPTLPPRPSTGETPPPPPPPAP